MKFIIINILLFISTHAVYAQTWPRYYGQPGRIEYVVDILETYDKGYLVCGYFESANYLQRWAWIIKTNINGEIIWEKILENTGSRVKPAAIDQTQDGGILICGMSLHANIYYPIIIKLNACGEKEWCKIFGGSPNATPWAQDIKETESGDIVVLVNQFGNIPQETIHLFKLTTQGEVIWKKAYATTSNYPNTHTKLAESILVTKEGKYLISGRGYWEQPWNPGGPMPLTPLFIMSDSDGNEEWVLPFGLNDTIIGIAFCVSKESHNTLLGLAYSNRGAKNTPLFAEFNHSGQQTNSCLLQPEKVNANLTSGTLRSMYSINSMNYAQGTYRYGPDQSIPLTVVELEDEIFGLDTIVANHAIYHGHFSPISFNKTDDNKLLSNSTITPTSVNYDIALAKLNLNLEYDTAYTLPITYDSLCTSGPPQSGFIYLNDCAIDMDLPGDANCDAVVNVNDVVSSVAKILGGIPQPFCPQNADVNGDGVLNVADVVGTVNIIMSRRGRY